jgi:hypothetical protein
MSKWISVSDKLPPKDKNREVHGSIDVLLKMTFKDLVFIKVGFYLYNQKAWYDNNTGMLLEIKWWDDEPAILFEPTHWCQIP